MERLQRRFDSHQEGTGTHHGGTGRHPRAMERFQQGQLTGETRSGGTCAGPSCPYRSSLAWERMAIIMPLPLGEGSVVAELKCEVVTGAWQASREHGDNPSAQASARAFQGPEQSSRLPLVRLQQRDGG